MLGDMITKRLANGSLQQCPTCQVPARQRHFLNECPILSDTRLQLQKVLYHELHQPLVSEGDFDSFFKSLHDLNVGNPREDLTPALISAMVNKVRKFSYNLNTMVDQIVQRVNALFSNPS